MSIAAAKQRSDAPLRTRWSADPRWTQSDVDKFTLHAEGNQVAVYDWEKDLIDVLRDDDTYRTGDVVVVQYVMADDDPFAVRGRVLGIGLEEGLLYVETRDGFALWVDPTNNPATYINGRPPIMRHIEVEELIIDVHPNRVVERVWQFYTEAQQYSSIVERLFKRCRTWVGHRHPYHATVAVAPAIVVAHRVPTKNTSGSLIKGFERLFDSLDKNDGVRARMAMAEVFPYADPNGTKPWHVRGRKQVIAFAEMYGLNLRVTDFNVFLGNKPLRP